MDETGQNMQFFEEVLFFSSYVQHKNRRKEQVIQLILCQLDVGGWWKEKGTTRLTLNNDSNSKTLSPSQTISRIAKPFPFFSTLLSLM